MKFVTAVTPLIRSMVAVELTVLTTPCQLGMSTHVVSSSELLIVHYKKMSIPLNSFQNELNWWLCLFLEDPANQ